MTSVKDSLAAEKPAKCLFVFLPGFGDGAEHFVKYGFFEAVRTRGLSADLVAADATIGYYNKGTFTERVEADVVGPLRNKGYQQTWVVGMSMGGMGTLMYSREHASQVTGFYALAPFLGSASLVQEIKDAGGLRAWKAPPKTEKLEEATYQRELWRWLQELTADPASSPKVYLGWGTEDRLGESASVLAAALPADHVFTVPGPHKWVPWRNLWDRFLDESEIKQACAP